MTGIWPGNPALPLPEHTTPAHELITQGMLGLGQHPPHQTDTPHTPVSILLPTKTLRASVIRVILQLSARNRLRNRPEKKNHLLEPH